MIFSLPMSAFPQSAPTTQMINSRRTEENGVVTVIHRTITCSVANSQLKCAATGSDLTSAPAKAINIKSFVPANLDFHGNDICLVSTTNVLACGSQPNLVANAPVTVAQINVPNVTALRMAVWWPFMCVRNTQSQVLCSQIDFTKSQTWTTMTNLKNIDSIKIRNGAICGHVANTDESAYECIQIGTKETALKNGKSTFIFDPKLGAAETESVTLNMPK
eukprot:NODE_617_length_5364_cov_0.787654.p3 type:complete len:219 gc:universal NODE_617_length_5364_cov_0.787654:3530-4186(+)